MKSFIKLFLLCLTPVFTMAQIDPTWGYVTAQQADSLKHSLGTQANDTLKMAAFRSLGFYYQDFIVDSGLYFHEQQLVLSKKLKMKLWEADAYGQAGYCLGQLGDLMKSYEYHSEAKKLAEDEKSESDNWRLWTFSNSINGHEARISILALNYQMMGNLWGYLSEFEKQRSYYEEAVKLGESINNSKVIFLGLANIARGLPPDSAIMYLTKGIRLAEAIGYRRTGFALLFQSVAYSRKGMKDSTLFFINKAIEVNLSDNYRVSLVFSYNAKSLFYNRQNKDSCLYFAKKAFETAQSTGLPFPLQLAYQRLSAAYGLYNNPDSAFKYERLSNRINDSLRNVQIFNLTKYQTFSFNEQLRLKKLDEEKTAYANKMNMLGLIALMSGILIVAIILYRNNRQKQKANKVLETTLANLRSTQSQLIQSEKMASLGELTAGIAHEIQNPLNFVNNFSEVNTELIDEAGQEIDKGNISEVKSILGDIKDNEQKISHHGKRADAIVKNMLLHSRGGSGAKEPTDINAMADEYMRLSFHGMRARDKSFNAKYKTSFDNTIGKINIVQQEIGRVLLNLINNAFYAVSDKAKQHIPGYDPTVTVTTKKTGAKISISVKDNGNGIPESIKEKIFQPFFTTKPTGQGTGLGLSLSYDIVKAHGGELYVETKEGEGSEFIISLPVT